MVKLNYNIHGEGEPLIVLHGLFGSARNWNTVAKALGTERRVITVDLRNHGGSEHTDSMSFTDMAGDIRDLMDELGLESAALLGHSLGGKVAMAFALSFPERTEALIPVDIAPADYPASYNDYVDTMLELPLARLRNRTEADRLLQAAGIGNAMIRQFLLQNLVRENDAFRWRLNLAALRRAMPELAAFPREWPAAPYPGPACFMAGGESDYILPRHYAEISRLFPRATVKTIEGAGHWIHAEKPEVFVKSVQDFLKEASDAGEE